MTDLVMTADGVRALTPGKFYWARIVVGDERHAVFPKTEWQPVRYTGRSAGSEGDTWDFIGFRSEDGHHFADVMEIGAEIVAP